MFINFSLPYSPLEFAGFFVAYAQEKTVEVVSLHLQERARKILHVGAGLSFLAILAAFIAKVTLTFFFALGAFFCFQLASWAFQERERRLSDTFHWENKKRANELVRVKKELADQILCVQSLRRDNENIKKANKELQKRNSGLEACSDQWALEVSSLKQQNEQLAKSVQELDVHLKGAERALRKFMES